MNIDRYRRAIEADAEAIAATPAGSLDQVVPACPGWTVADAITHTGMVHRFVTRLLETRAFPDRGDFDEAPAGADLPPWFAEGAGALLAALDTADPDADYPTQIGDRPLPFWYRRQAHEIAVHRHDAAAGRPSSTVETALACDGVDEMFDVMVPRRFDFDTFGAPATIHLHATDGGDTADHSGEWLITVTGDEVIARHEHRKGDVAARGSASDLFLLLYNRVDATELDIAGDPTVLDRWRAAVQI